MPNADNSKEYVFKICTKCRKKTDNWTKEAICNYCNSSTFIYDVMLYDEVNQEQPNTQKIQQTTDRTKFIS